MTGCCFIPFHRL